MSHDELLRLAEKGNAKAQFMLGVAYRYGHDVEKNAERSLYWLEKSAMQGYDNAIYSLGLFCFLDKDKQSAYMWNYLFYMKLKDNGEDTSGIEANLEDLSSLDSPKIEEAIAEAHERYTIIKGEINC